MNKGNALPVFARGFGRVRLALRTSLSVGANVGGRLDASTEPMRWSSACLRDGYEVRYRRNLDDLGYRDVPMRGTRSDALNAVCHLRGLFSDEAVDALREIGRALERSASSSNWIISKRVRAVTNRSRFVDDMMHDRAFLLRVSRLAGVPLIPYPMANARSQFNYYYPTDQRDGKEQLGMWHTDTHTFGCVGTCRSPVTSPHAANSTRLTQPCTNSGRNSPSSLLRAAVSARRR